MESVHVAEERFPHPRRLLDSLCAQAGGCLDADDGLAGPRGQDIEGGVAVMVQEGEELSLLEWDVETRVEHSVEEGFVLAQEAF